MRDTKVKELIVSGFFVAMGIVLPMMFHAVGLGSTFLPMHIPVLIGGYFLDMPYALVVGVITPILSFILTGMPPAFPVLPYMIFELAVYGAMTSIFYRKIGKNPYISLVFAMICGRIAAGIVVSILALLFAAKLPGPITFMIGAIVQGLPGIIIQLIFIPPTVILAQAGFAKKGGEKIEP